MTKIVDFESYRFCREMIKQEDNALPILDILEKLDSIDIMQINDMYFGIREGNISLNDFKYWLDRR